MIERLKNKWRRFTVARYGRREFTPGSRVPYVSFTFDDFPRTALSEGGRILAAHGARGTYFVSFDLLGGPSPSGPIASEADIPVLLEQGHELGCHTFEHLDGRISTADAFERSIEANHRALQAVAPGHHFSVFAYPLYGPVLSIKKAVGRHFAGCRGGGQVFNAGTMDLNLLQAYFLDWRNRGNLEVVRQIIAANAESCGWLIFATHDVAPEPSRYGCEPEYFDAVIGMSIASGARVLPMGQAFGELSVAAGGNGHHEATPRGDH